MGATGVVLQVAGDGDRETLHAAMWEAARDFIEMYTGSSTYDAVKEYLGEAIPVGRKQGAWGVNGDSLFWMFKDFAGCCSRSAGLWSHWLALAYAVEWNSMARLAEDHGLTLVSAGPALAAELAQSVHYVAMRNDLWSVDTQRLYGDDRTIAVGELDATECAQHSEALARCLCGPCTMLRPEADFAAAMQQALDAEETAASAAWYLARTSATSPAILAALVRAGRTGMRPLLAAVERYAVRVETAWDTLLPLLPNLPDGARGLAFYALAESRRDDADIATLLPMLRAALAEDGAAAAAAAELCGRIGRGVPHLAEELARVLDRDGTDELRHSVVLGLVNLHLPPSQPSAAVHDRLAREAARETAAGRLAAWILNAL